MLKSPEEFHRRTNELSELYSRVRKLIILSENIDERKEIYIAPLNELRSALDHFFKANTAEDQTEFNNSFEQVKEHLYRAGYDTFEVLGGNLGMYILEIFKRYDPEAITKVFPEYYRSIKPKLIECQTAMAEIRNARKSHCINFEYFDKYYDLILPLIDDYNLSVKMVPSLEECHKKSKSNNLKNRLWQIGIPVFCIFLTYFLTNYLSCNKSVETKKSSQDTTIIKVH